MLAPGTTLHSIQILRGAAALAVALAHLHAVELKFGGPPVLGAWAQAGFGGVDLFFVISGFVMVWVTRGDQGRAAAVPLFWAGRAARIYPLWWLVCGAVFAVWLVRPDWVYASHGSNPDIVRSFLLLPHTELPLHAVGWTLIHEIYFYLVFGLMLLLPARALPWALGAWAALAAATALALPGPDNPWLALARHPLTLEFIAGAVVGLFAARGWFPAPQWMLRAGLFWIVLAAISISDNPPAAFSGEWERVFKFGLPCALVVWGAVGLEANGARMSGHLAVFGDWSYALYLIHVPAFAAVGRLAAPLSVPGPFDNALVLGVALLVAIVAAAILHHAVERPVMAVSRKLRRQQAAGVV